MRFTHSSAVGRLRSLIEETLDDFDGFTGVPATEDAVNTLLEEWHVGEDLAPEPDFRRVTVHAASPARRLDLA